MRCPDCNKFVSYDDLNEPDTDDLDFLEGIVEGTIRIVLPCAECSTELKEYSFDVEHDLYDEILEHQRDNHPETVEGEDIVDDTNLTFRIDSAELTINTKGTGRWTETFYGYAVDVSVYCDRCKTEIVEVQLTDEIKASEMDELV